MKESITKLVEEMKELKAEYDSLSISDILRIFHIAATKELAGATRRMVIARG